MGGADIDDFVLMKKVRIKIPKLKRNKSTLWVTKLRNIETKRLFKLVVQIKQI